MERLKILTLTTIYPTPAEPTFGIFVRSRLQHMAEFADVRVLAPVPLITYGLLGKNGKHESQPLPRGWRRDEHLEVLFPRWVYPPLGGWMNIPALVAQTGLRAGRLRSDFPFDLIDAHFGHPDGAAAAMLAWWFRCPFTVTLRGFEPRHAKTPGRRRAMSWALRRAGRVITVSGRLRDFAISLGAVPERVLVIPNGIDSSIFHPRNREESRARHAVPPGTRLILSAGYLIERKGHHLAMRALRCMLDKGVQAQLWIVGVAGREDDFEGHLRELLFALRLEKYVRFFGHAQPDQLAELMSAADVLCLASNNEGWPNVVHEALGCGLPVVASDVGAIPAMLPSGEYGSVVPVNDIEALEKALTVALSRQWDRRGIAAWGARRSWTQVGREVVEAMREVVSST